VKLARTGLLAVYPIVGGATGSGCLPMPALRARPGPRRRGLSLHWSGGRQRSVFSAAACACRVITTMLMSAGENGGFAGPACSNNTEMKGRPTRRHGLAAPGRPLPGRVSARRAALWRRPAAHSQLVVPLVLGIWPESRKARDADAIRTESR